MVVAFIKKWQNSAKNWHDFRKNLVDLVETWNDLKYFWKKYIFFKFTFFCHQCIKTWFVSIFQSFLMNATQLFTCDGSTKSPPGSGAPSMMPSIPGSSNPDKANPSTHVFIQGWMLMSLAVSIFVPKSSKLLWFLRAHFARNKDTKWEPFSTANFEGRFYSNLAVFTWKIDDFWI